MKNPDWIVSTFLAAAPRTVTAENKGQFTDNWNGLDDNFMPVPPGKYGVKGIYMPAQKWRVDGEWHSITPQFVDRRAGVDAVGAGGGQAGTRSAAIRWARRWTTWRWGRTGWRSFIINTWKTA